jgi:hypothetical protein
MLVTGAFGWALVIAFSSPNDVAVAVSTSGSLAKFW